MPHNWKTVAEWLIPVAIGVLFVEMGVFSSIPMGWRILALACCGGCIVIARKKSVREARRRDG